MQPVASVYAAYHGTGSSYMSLHFFPSGTIALFVA